MPLPFKLLIAASALLCATPAFAGEKRIWRIDSLIASQKDGEMVIAAKGAVQSGGWKAAKLRLLRMDGHNLVVEFLAAAPPPGMTVIEALVPVEAQLRVKGHAGSVRAVAEANEMTTQVLH